MSYLTNINISVFYNSKKNEKSNVTTFPNLLIIVESRYGIHIEIPFSFPPCDIRIINLQKIIKFLE